MDLNGYINPQWWRVAVIPSEKTMKAGEYVSLRDAIEQYTRSESSMKNIVCQKQILGWNFADLSFKIKSLIYSTGYRNHIKVVSYFDDKRKIEMSIDCVFLFRISQ